MKRNALWLPVLLAGVQCSEVNAPKQLEDTRPTLNGLIVSGHAFGAGGASGIQGAPVTYVSLPPGTVSVGSNVVIRNRTLNNPEVTIATVDGGFDPVVIGASADDRLDITVFAPGVSPRTYPVVVPKRRPPLIVRTNPPKGRADVALKIQPVIVFSEPIDAASVSTALIRVLENGAPISGTVQLSSNGWTAEFTPDIPFKSKTTYRIQVTQDIRDLDGDALPQGAEIRLHDRGRA